MLKTLHEILQVALEMVGLLLVAAGLGVAAYRLCGWPGLLVVSGLVFTAAAYTAERELHPRKPRPRRPVPAEPRVVVRARGRIGWLAGPTDRPRSGFVAWSLGRLAWLHDPED